MTISKEVKSLNMPWEQEYGYSQAVKVGDTVYVSGQISHDEKGEFVGVGDMEAQMRQCYANIKKLLAEYGATMDNIVDETLFVTDMETALGASLKCRREIFSGAPVAALTAVNPRARVSRTDDRDQMRRQGVKPLSAKQII